MKENKFIFKILKWVPPSKSINILLAAKQQIIQLDDNERKSQNLRDFTVTDINIYTKATDMQQVIEWFSTNKSCRDKRRFKQQTRNFF